MTAQIVSGAAVGVATGLADDKLIEGPIEDRFPDYSIAAVAENAGVKTIKVSLQYKHTTKDAELGFYRSSLHKDTSPNSLFGNIKEYLAVEKGWFNPFLFASGRRPVIPRSMTPDVVFCHGPFESGDYDIGQMLVAESSAVICFSSEFARQRDGGDVTDTGGTTDGTISEVDENGASKADKKKAKAEAKARKAAEKQAKKDEKARAKEEKKAAKSANAAQEDSKTTVVQPRHLAVLLLGLKPHRGGSWTSSARPGESVIRYQLFVGVPAIVLPAKVGAPLVSWDAYTLKEMWKSNGDVQERLNALFEFLELCVDFDRVDGGKTSGLKEQAKKEVVRKEFEQLLSASVHTAASQHVNKEVDSERAGIVFWRIP